MNFCVQVTTLAHKSRGLIKLLVVADRRPFPLILHSRTTLALFFGASDPSGLPSSSILTRVPRPLNSQPVVAGHFDWHTMQHINTLGKMRPSSRQPKSMAHIYFRSTASELSEEGSSGTGSEWVLLGTSIITRVPLPLNSQSVMTGHCD